MDVFKDQVYIRLGLYIQELGMYKIKKIKEK